MDECTFVICEKKVTWRILFCFEFLSLLLFLLGSNQCSTPTLFSVQTIAMFQMLNSHMWLIAFILDNSEHFQCSVGQCFSSTSWGVWISQRANRVTPEEQQVVTMECQIGMELWRALDAKIKFGLYFEASGFLISEIPLP